MTKTECLKLLIPLHVARLRAEHDAKYFGLCSHDLEGFIETSTAIKLHQSRFAYIEAAHEEEIDQTIIERLTNKLNAKAAGAGRFAELVLGLTKYGAHHINKHVANATALRKASNAVQQAVTDVLDLRAAEDLRRGVTRELFARTFGVDCSLLNLQPENQQHIENANAVHEQLLASQLN